MVKTHDPTFIGFDSVPASVSRTAGQTPLTASICSA